MHTRDVVKVKTIQINSVGPTEKHTYIYDFRDHSRRLQVIFDAHPKEFFGVKLQQTVVLTGLDKYILVQFGLYKKGFR